MITIHEFPKKQQDNVLLIHVTNEKKDSWSLLIRVVNRKFEISVTEGPNLLFGEQSAFFTADPSLPSCEHTINLPDLSQEDLARVEQLMEDNNNDLLPSYLDELDCLEKEKMEYTPLGDDGFRRRFH
ncbi:hypothetical protein [Legionella waltersii]|nr:hypothetical protein [Legionella waltersii]